MQTGLARSTFVLGDHEGRNPEDCVPTPTDTSITLLKFLYPEEQVPNLVDYFGVSTRLTTWEALIRGENKI